MQRREFMETMALAGVAGAVGVRAFADDESKQGDMLYRKLGRTGETISALGLGGFHIGTQKEESESVKLIRDAIDAGVTFMDNSWDYHNGGSEIRMGKALKDGYRKRVFVMTKIDGRDKKTAAKQIDDSLKRLDVDVIDLLQHHEIIRMEDPDRIFAEGGAQDAVEEAKTAGKIRYIGFTGHKDPLVHLRMLEVARQHDFTFDAVQMPLNVMDAHFRSFARHVVPVLVQAGIGVLGMKPMGSGAILDSKTVTAVECLHYALSLPTSTVITGIDSQKILQQALNAVKSFQRLSDEQIADLLSKTKEAAATGDYEGFKTTSSFDATAHNPSWLGPPEAKSS
jgi:predicted aldo/keto reductase-like oxidoreductase